MQDSESTSRAIHDTSVETSYEYYYLTKSADIPRLFNNHVSQIKEKDDKFYAAIAFFAEVFRNNASELQTLVGKINKTHTLSPLSLEILFQALRQADVHAARSILMGAKISADNLMQETATNALNTRVVDLFTQKIRKQSKLDVLWASFCASGKKHYLMRIISRGLVSDKGIDPTVATYARDLIKDKANHHPRVVEIAAEMLPSLQAKQQEELKKILGVGTLNEEMIRKAMMRKRMSV